MKDLWKSIACLLVLVAIGLAETKTLKHEYVQASDDSFTAQVELLETRLTDKWHPSVKALQKLIKRDPIIEYNWVYGLSLCTATIKNRTSDQVLSLINAALLTPPAYFNTPLVGFPINSVLIEFMQTENGRNFFSHREVNAIFKEIMDQYNRMIQRP